jgi:hypothetical protein
MSTSRKVDIDKVYREHHKATEWYPVVHITEVCTILQHPDQAFGQLEGGRIELKGYPRRLRITADENDALLYVYDNDDSGHSPPRLVGVQ